MKLTSNLLKRNKLGRNVLFVMLFLAVIMLTCARAAKEGQTCVNNSNCDLGLHCEACVADGNVRPRCTRVQPLSPFSKVKGLPFNRYSWLTTHNAFAKLGEKSATGSVVLAPMNQQDSWLIMILKEVHQQKLT
ncbi:PI-PLC X domain-containing protein At5g67130-like [Rutidosis leptorrhynchoides]|uniref:PI-PLC X domain-containing protein At5g67130-like n=1 Tax=Rutidosis leptorrhynchoides TaxID=125765 RepID=UPI003A99FA4A